MAGGANLHSEVHHLKSTENPFHHIRTTIISGKTPHDIPEFGIKTLTKLVLGAVTGPHAGLHNLQIETPPSKRDSSSEESDGVGDTTDEPPSRESTSKGSQNNDDDLVAGISNWKQPIKQADGDSLTLYEHKPDSSEHRCDPIGDVYAGIVRPNNAVLAVATGHNSGLKSRQAASSAVRGCVEKLNETLLSESMPKTTRQMTAHILSSFGFAQEVIRKHEGATASLCVAVVCSLDRHWGHEQWGLCVVSVGSVSCFVWQNRTGIVYEVTSAGLRGATDVKGSLGTIVNGEPDLGGLMCSYVHVASNDVVFLATRGIYDNFDPQLNGTAVIEHVGSPTEVATDQPTDIHPSDSEKREERILRELTEVLRKRRARRKSDHLSALALKEALIEHVVEVTSEKRTFLDKSWQDMKYSYFLSEEERATMEKEIFQSADAHPGVLEHATVVAYQVGLLSENASHKRTNLFLYSPTISDLSIGDNEDESISEGQ